MAISRTYAEPGTLANIGKLKAINDKINLFQQTGQNLPGVNAIRGSEPRVG